jgi:hypothetical protein
VEIGYCADGWHDTSGSAARPLGDAICQCVFERELHSRYNELHPEPVVWRIRRYDGSCRMTSWWCDAELPDEIRGLLPKDGGER